MTSRVLYLFGSAAPPVADVAKVIEEAQRRGWDVCLGLTPTAARWLGEQLRALEELTGHPVRSEYKLPGEPDVWPKADVIAFAPVTFHSVNVWALGLTRDFVIGVVAEGIGKGIPIVAMPCVNSAYVQHNRFERSVTELRAMGVTVLYGEGGFVPNQPGQGRPSEYPWGLLLDAVDRLAPRA
ncbi:flavoprotein [Streptomyces acidiscabies]|uniref:flavoprotein n=1 Tax=Streptomyces acidiscabies TaxID=42234 RepID=UPI000952A1DC|nr:flavoprotein [Streptomyces acidiscabies]GAV42867.1 bifunctional phosphopantothenoylcysteine decarboxylase/phosphopantothenate synthase [Streptomyces acidiscabies]